MKVQTDFETREKWLEYQLCWAIRISTRVGLMEAKAILTENGWNVSEALAYINSDKYKQRTRFRL